MAMSMNEFFLYSGTSEPNYIVNYARHSPHITSLLNSDETGHQNLAGAPGRNNNSRTTTPSRRHTVVSVLELMVPMCCAKCAEKVTKALWEVEGVNAVMCDRYSQKVTVTGNVDSVRALKKAKQVQRKSELWVEASSPAEK